MERTSHPELDDQPWLPRGIRDGLTDYLRFLTTVVRPYDGVVGVLADTIRRSGAAHVVDLASGGGGSWPQLRPDLARRGVQVDVTLTDRFPNHPAAERLETQPGLTYRREPVDARSVPRDLIGFRTMFSTFHHFEPDAATAILRDAAERSAGIAVFEAVSRSAAALALAPFVPLPLLFAAPFLKPLRWSRLLWTYLLPALPMVLAWDALVSVRKAYAPAELLALARLARADYDWRVGQAAGRSPLHVTYLVGTPVASRR